MKGVVVKRDIWRGEGGGKGVREGGRREGGGGR